MTSGEPRVACAEQRVVGIIQIDADTIKTVLFTVGFSSCALLPNRKARWIWSLRYRVVAECDVFHT